MKEAKDSIAAITQVVVDTGDTAKRAQREDVTAFSAKRPSRTGKIFRWREDAPQSSSRKTPDGTDIDSRAAGEGMDESASRRADPSAKPAAASRRSEEESGNTGRSDGNTGVSRAGQPDLITSTNVPYDLDAATSSFCDVPSSSATQTNNPSFTSTAFSPPREEEWAIRQPNLAEVAPKPRRS